MNSTEINQRLLAIKAVPGKNDKIAMLKESLEDRRFRWVVQQMLDPRVRFGVAAKTLSKIEKETEHNILFDHKLDFTDQTTVNIDLMLEAMASGQLTGGAAVERLATCYKELNGDSWSLLTKILLKKPDAGFTDSSVNKAREDTIFTFECMLAHKFEEKRIKQWPVAVEPKIDGVRCLVMVEPNGTSEVDVAFFSRTGKEFTTFGLVAEQIRARWAQDEKLRERGWIIDCEIDSGQFNETVSQARKKEGDAADAVARIFDLVPVDVWNGERACPDYGVRRRAIEAIFGVGSFDRLQPVQQWICHTVEEIMQHNNRIQAEGGEGVIVKPLDHLYERKRSYNWLKVKGFETFDLVITGFFEGQGKYAGQMGGVIVKHGDVEVRVGGGWTDDDRQVMWADQASFKGRMIEVGCHEVTPDGSLRHPRFVRFRDDKHQQEAA